MLRDPQNPQGRPIDESDFQFVLNRLFDGCPPFAAGAAGDLHPTGRAMTTASPDCGEEIDRARQIFEKFLTEEVAVRILGCHKGADDGGSEWLWCLRQIRCCIVFGWLVSRRPGNHRSFLYFLYRYWACVRESLGTPVSTPMTHAQRRDLRTVFRVVAGDAQLDSVRFPGLHPGRHGDFGRARNGAPAETKPFPPTRLMLARLFTAENAPALFGREASRAKSRSRWFQSCLNWRLPAGQFGSSLAQAGDALDAARCLREFFFAVRRPIPIRLAPPRRTLPSPEPFGTTTG